MSFLLATFPTSQTFSVFFFCTCKAGVFHTLLFETTSTNSADLFAKDNSVLCQYIKKFKNTLASHVYIHVCPGLAFDPLDLKCTTL